MNLVGEIKYYYYKLSTNFGFYFMWGLEGRYKKFYRRSDMKSRS